MCRWPHTPARPSSCRRRFTGRNSLVDQSLHSRLGAEPTNGDGFGVGWYGAPPTPGVFHSIEPAWNDQNLREIAGHISSPLFFTHIRAAIGSAVQQTNCHPFRHDHWLFMHNGYINEFARIKRDLVLAVDPSLYPEIKGQADTEVLFYLAVTLGLEDDPPAAVEQAIGVVEAIAAPTASLTRSRARSRRPTARASGRFATPASDVALAVLHDRGSEAAQATSRDKATRQFSDNARLIVSEPLGEVAVSGMRCRNPLMAMSARTTPNFCHSNPKHRRPPCQSLRE